MTSMDAHEHGEATDCAGVLEQVHQFLDNELDTASGDAIRQHLAACEPCLEQFDVEAAVKALVSRCCGGDQAPSSLRVRVLVTIAEAHQAATS
jgi:mycothiol system anti-sigma-R factor